MKNKNRVIFISSILIALLLITVGVSYAIFQFQQLGSKENTVKTGNITFVYDEQNQIGNGVIISNALPMSDEEGKEQSGNNNVFEFQIEASTKGAPIFYEIYATKEAKATIPEYIVKTYLTSITGIEETGLKDPSNQQEINLYSKLGDSKVVNTENGKTLYQEMIPEGEENYQKTFRFRVWIDAEADETFEGKWMYSGRSFSVKINIYASNEAIESPTKITEPNAPELVEGMIGVTYDEVKKSWVKADTTKEWYNYEKQEWANAVTVVESGTNTREYYQNSPVGTVIPMEDINTMWVWIPRYEYMYTNLGDQYAGGTKDQPGEIQINFISKETINPSSSEYKVHPAFTFGEDELSGIWVGKFETTGTLPSTNYCRDESCDVSTVTIKPGVAALGKQQVASLFYMTRSMQTNNANTYGFASDNSYDLHMSKNSEWGAVAYLSQSRYGKYGNINYEGVDKEVFQNKSADFITGSSNGTPGTDVVNEQTSYSVDYFGTGASTTGTIYGIYDMSGGSYEYVMGNYNRYSGYTARNYTIEEAKTILGRTDGAAASIWNSGFNGPVYGNDLDGSPMSWTTGVDFPEKKYFDLYTTNNANSACDGRICYGDALSETARWYADAPWFIDAAGPWFIRGGLSSINSEAGIFYFSRTSGNADPRYVSRSILSPLT